MSYELLRLNRGTSDQNSRAVESTARSIMSTHFADLSIHFDVNRTSRYSIVLVPCDDDSVSDFEADTGGTLCNSLDALKTRLIADDHISLYANMATMLGLADSDSSDDDDAGSDIDQHVQSRDWAYTSDGDFVPGQADRSTPQPAAAYEHGRDTGNTAAIFGRAGTTVVTQRRPAHGQFAVALFQINHDASSDDDSHNGDRSATSGVGGPGSGPDSDDTGDSDDTYLDDSDDSDDSFSDDSDDSFSDDSDDSFSDDSDDSDDSFADAQSSEAFNRAVDNAEMRTVAGEPETTEQRDLAKRIAKAIAGTSSFTKADTLDTNGKPKPLSELMRMARVTSL